VGIENERSQQDWVRFYTLLGVSVIMATVGLYRDSGAVVIAAMLIAPLMSPILDIASTMVMGWTGRVLKLLLAVVVASAFTVLLSFLIPFLVDAPRGMVIPDQVMDRTNPGLEEMIIALAAGIAGAYVQMRKQEAALLPGVAIGVSLVPPLSAAGLLLYFHEPVLAWEAVLLFLTNLAAIVLCACMVFLVLGLRPKMREKGYAVRLGVSATVMFVVVGIITLSLSQQTAKRFQEAREEELVVIVATAWIGSHPIEIQRVDVDREAVEIVLIFDVPLEFAAQLKSPEAMLAEELDARVLMREVSAVLERPVKTIFRGQIRYSGVYFPHETQ
jgi:uncharacterized hydrophobic protein (TIGR00271 family)